MPSANPPDIIDQLAFKVSDLAGAPPDHIKLLLLLILSFVLALPYPYFPAVPLSTHKHPTALRIFPTQTSFASVLPHIYSVAISAFYLVGVLKLLNGYIQLVVASALTWLIVGLAASKYGFVNNAKDGNAKGQSGAGMVAGLRWPWWIFIGTMAHLTVNHVWRMVTNTPLDIIEITAAHMVLVMKLSAFAWNVYDGTRPEEKLDKQQMEVKLDYMPSLLEFLGYAFFFPGLLVGPAFRYKTYEIFISREVFSSIKGKEKNVSIPPGRFLVAGNRLLFGLVNMAVYSLYGAKFSYEGILAPEFLAKTGLHRILYLQLAGLSARLKYYAIWKLSEGSFVVSGLAYNTDNNTWTRARNIEVRKIELAQNYKTLLDAWNANTNVWLRETVYKRVTKEGKKPGFVATMVTFGTSAFWHGPNPVYFMTFILGGFYQQLGRSIRTYIRPYFLPPTPSYLKFLYDVICIINIQITLNFAAAPFMILELGPTLEAWKRLYWYGLWYTLVPFTFFQMGGGKIFVRKGKTAEDGRKTRNKVLAVNGEAPKAKVNGGGPEEITGMAPQGEIPGKELK